MKRVLTALVIGSLSACAFAGDAISFVQGTGTQSFDGPLGIDFTAQSTFDILSIGAFDNSGLPFSSPVTVQLWDKADLTAPVLSVVIGPSTPTVLQNGVRYTNIAPFQLTAGVDYSLVAYGFGPTNLSYDYNTNTGSPANGHTLSTLSGLISWDLNSEGAVLNRFGYTDGAFPTLDNNGANYGANWQLPNASFSNTAVPGPAAAIPFVLGAVLRRRRKR